MDDSWPPHKYEIRPWQQAARGGTKADRMLREVTVTLPPLLGNRNVHIDSVLATELESAVREITALDVEAGDHRGSLGVLLLRTESVASSKIEYIDANLDDYARALHGAKSNQAATSMAAATAALEVMITEVARSKHITLSTITSAHAALMRDDLAEPSYAGRLRDVQNWIGGTDYSPRGALYVAPPPETIATYLDDLVLFANRDDVPVVVQAAIAHAQFESIHPFTDGNGRIGRALINGILRRRATTTRIVVPLASALVAHRDRYFDLLDRYREGDPQPIIKSFAQASRIAAEQSRETAKRLMGIPVEWSESVGIVRQGSAVAKVLAVLPAHPILSVDEALGLVGGAASSVYAAIERLHAAGVVRPLTDRTRNQVWGASAVLTELDDLGRRIAMAAK